MTNTTTLGSLDIAISVPVFRLNTAPYLLGVTRDDLEDLELALAQAAINIEDYYSHMFILELYLKMKYEESDHFDEEIPWEKLVADKFNHFVESLLIKLTEILNGDKEIVNLTYMDPGSFIIGCQYEKPAREQPRNFRKKKMRRSGSFGFKNYSRNRRSSTS